MDIRMATRGLSFKVCPGCGVHNQIQVGSRSELNYFRVILMGCNQKDFFCGVDCYQKYLQKNYGDSSKLSTQLVSQLKLEFKETQLKLAQEEHRNRQEVDDVSKSIESMEGYHYTTKRRSSHTNTKTNALDIDVE